MLPVFEKVVAAHDRYGLHAYLTALENADLRGKLDAELQASARIGEEGKKRLLNVLHAGTLTGAVPSTAERVPNNVVTLR